MAQDVQEFNRELQDKLESLMKVRGLLFVPPRRRTGRAEQLRVSQGTRVEGVIPKLFRGKMKSSIKCVNVEYEESKVEEFNGEKNST